MEYFFASRHQSFLPLASDGARYRRSGGAHLLQGRFCLCCSKKARRAEIRAYSAVLSGCLELVLRTFVPSLLGIARNLNARHAALFHSQKNAGEWEGTLEVSLPSLLPLVAALI